MTLGAGGCLLVAESHGGVVVGLVDLGSLEDHLVDEGRGDASKDGSQPVDPVVLPGSEDDSGSEGTSGVHAGAGEGNSEEMAGGDGESDGEGSRSFDGGSVVVVSSGSEDNQNENEGDEELDSEGLSDSEMFIDGRHAETASAVDFLRGEALEKSSPDESADTLEHDVEESLEDSDLASEDESEGDGRVDVAAGDVTDALSDRRDRHAEREGDADDVGSVASHARAASNQNEEHCSEEFSGQTFCDLNDFSFEFVDADVRKKGTDCGHRDFRRKLIKKKSE